MYGTARMTVVMEYWLVVRWLVVYLFLFAAGLPIAAVICPRLADRGAGIALPVSLAVIGVVGYWVGRLSFGWVALGAGLFVLGGLSVSIYLRAPVDIERRPAIEAAVVFTLAFLFLVAVRAVDPAVHPSGGEKFLDYGLLRSLLRAPTLPPEDMWFAGEPVKYYYGGHMLSALLTELTFTEARYAYNLALAGFYAMLVTAAYGLAGSLGKSIGTARSTASALGAFFVGFASNLQTPFRALLWALPDEIARTIVNALGIEREGLIVALSEFSYWNASRVIPGQPSDPDSYSIATEFPLFSWLNGDLHAHMMSTPFLVLVATLCFSYYRTPADERMRRRLLVGATVVLAGFIAVINTWSFPTVFGLLWLTLVFSPAAPLSLLPDRAVNWVRSHHEHWVQTRLTHELQRIAGALVLVVALAPIGIAVSLPFWLDAASGRAIALVPERSPLLSLLLVHGGFLLVFVPYLFGRLRPFFQKRTIAALSIGLLVGAVVFQFAALAVIAPIALGAWALLRIYERSEDHEHELENEDEDESIGTTTNAGGVGFHSHIGYPAVLILAGAGLLLLVEVIYLHEQAGPSRYNTVFKTYLQVWILWGLSAGAALARFAHWPHAVRSSFPDAERVVSSSFGFGAEVGLRQVFVALLIISTSLYGSLALSNHFTANGTYANPDDPTLDVFTYTETYHSEEVAAIQWLDRRSGRPVVAAAPGTDIYQWTNAVSSLTGLPTIAGWSHEVGYRNSSVYHDRVEDVDTLYQGPPDRTIQMLRHYDVRYIYVGPREREQYERMPFDQIAGLNEKRFGDVRIYEVDQRKLAVKPQFRNNVTTHSLSIRSAPTRL